MLFFCNWIPLLFEKVDGLSVEHRRDKLIGNGVVDLELSLAFDQLKVIEVAVFWEDDAGVVDGLIGENHEDGLCVNFGLYDVPVDKLLQTLFEVGEGFV